MSRKEARAPRRKPATAAKAGPVINLALQGGGAHGAYTWGVLDALLEDGRLGFDGVTGASAGAMNAVVMADGWLDGLARGDDPRAAARAGLRSFWTAVGAQPSGAPLNAAWTLSNGRGGMANPFLLWLDLLTRMFSPYQLNPFDYNPLRTVLTDRVDFERLQRQAPFKLFIAATNVRSGRVRVFREHEVSLPVLLASACLPMAFQAVEVVTDGKAEHYWDGGFMGNPALWPLFYATRTSDLLLVAINPLRREELPDSAQEIVERMSEISFNASLLHEMRAINFTRRLLAEGKLDPAQYRDVWLHMIAGEDDLRDFGASSKSDTRPAFLAQLFDLGRARALQWLEDKFDYVGHTGTVRIAEVFL
jgi:NTE family protein